MTTNITSRVSGVCIDYSTVQCKLHLLYTVRYVATCTSCTCYLKKLCEELEEREEHEEREVEREELR